MGRRTNNKASKGNKLRTAAATAAKEESALTSEQNTVRFMRAVIAASLLQHAQTPAPTQKQQHKDSHRAATGQVTASAATDNGGKAGMVLSKDVDSVAAHQQGLIKGIDSLTVRVSGNDPDAAKVELAVPLHRAASELRALVESGDASASDSAGRPNNGETLPGGLSERSPVVPLYRALPQELRTQTLEFLSATFNVPSSDNTDGESVPAEQFKQYVINSISTFIPTPNFEHRQFSKAMLPFAEPLEQIQAGLKLLLEKPIEARLTDQVLEELEPPSPFKLSKDGKRLVVSLGKATELREFAKQAGSAQAVQRLKLPSQLEDAIDALLEASRVFDHVRKLANRQPMPPTNQQEETVPLLSSDNGPDGHSPDSAKRTRRNLSAEKLAIARRLLETYRRLKERIHMLEWALEGVRRFGRTASRTGNEALGEATAEAAEHQDDDAGQKRRRLQQRVENLILAVNRNSQVAAHLRTALRQLVIMCDTTVSSLMESRSKIQALMQHRKEQRIDVETKILKAGARASTSSVNRARAQIEDMMRDDELQRRELRDNDSLVEHLSQSRAWIVACIDKVANLEAAYDKVHIPTINDVKQMLNGESPNNPVAALAGDDARERAIHEAETSVRDMQTVADSFAEHMQSSVRELEALSALFYERLIDALDGSMPVISLFARTTVEQFKEWRARALTAAQRAEQAERSKQAAQYERNLREIMRELEKEESQSKASRKHQKQSGHDGSEAGTKQMEAGSDTEETHADQEPDEASEASTPQSAVSYEDAGIASTGVLAVGISTVANDDDDDEGWETTTQRSSRRNRKADKKDSTQTTAARRRGKQSSGDNSTNASTHKPKTRRERRAQQKQDSPKGADSRQGDRKDQSTRPTKGSKAVRDGNARSAAPSSKDSRSPDTNQNEATSQTDAVAATTETLITSSSKAGKDVSGPPDGMKPEPTAAANASAPKARALFVNGKRVAATLVDNESSAFRFLADDGDTEGEDDAGSVSSDGTVKTTGDHLDLDTASDEQQRPTEQDRDDTAHQTDAEQTEEASREEKQQLPDKNVTLAAVKTDSIAFGSSADDAKTQAQDGTNPGSVDQAELLNADQVAEDSSAEATSTGASTPISDSASDSGSATTASKSSSANRQIKRQFSPKDFPAQMYNYGPAGPGPFPMMVPGYPGHGFMPPEHYPHGQAPMMYPHAMHGMGPGFVPGGDHGMHMMMSPEYMAPHMPPPMAGPHGFYGPMPVPDPAMMYQAQMQYHIQHQHQHRYNHTSKGHRHRRQRDKAPSGTTGSNASASTSESGKGNSSVKTDSAKPNADFKFDPNAPQFESKLAQAPAARAEQKPTATSD